MSSNLDYLAPDLLPLEEKVKAYLRAEESLRQATLATNGAPLPAASQPDATPQSLQALEDDLSALHHELLALLPTRDEWVKVNLGYGPSRVGAWHVPATDEVAEHYQVRVVH